MKFFVNPATLTHIFSFEASGIQGFFDWTGPVNISDTSGA